MTILKKCRFLKSMLRETSPKVKLNPRVGFPGICEFAQQIQKSRCHVWAVLKGRRLSPRILAAWNAYKNNKAA